MRQFAKSRRPRILIPYKEEYAMKTAFKISEAGVLGLHTMALFAADPERRISSIEISDALGCSRNTLAKVLQRLARKKLVKSLRGPTGGFILTRSPSSITALQIYEAIDGKIHRKGCFFTNCRCKKVRCILGGVVDEMNSLVADRFGDTTLDALAESMNLIK